MQTLDIGSAPKRRLGNSDMQLSPIGFGAWAIGGGDWQHGWGAQEDNDSIAAIRRSIELGANWIDTAAVYGLGHSEEIVAKALDGMADRPYLFTKCAMTWGEDRKIVQTLRQIRRECEESLRRLNVDTIDLYQIHWPNPDNEVEEGWQTMADLQREGKVRWIGVSNFNVGQMERAQAIAPITSLQPPYSLINRSVEAEILPYTLSHGIGVINYSPMQSGLLTGSMTVERVQALPDNDFRKRAKNYQQPLLDRNLKLADLLKHIGEAHGVSAGVVAIVWTLRNPAVTAAIAGGRSAQQVDGVAPAANFQLSPEEAETIHGYLREHLSS